MNKTFKVVFNKARGALMVANEVTNSVQKKGVKMIVATAVAALSATTAIADDVTTKTYTYDSNNKPSDGWISEKGNVNLTINGLTFENLGAEFDGSALFFGNAKGSITLSDTTFQNNNSQNTKIEIKGGAAYSSGATFKQTNGGYTNNSATSTAGSARGGALMLKGNATAILQDVIFTKNSVQSNTDFAWGGALYLDYSTGNETGVIT